MHSQQFRGVLLRIQDLLSDNDRKRLHFFFHNEVPRHVRDDLSPGGTLILLESLYSQGKIDEGNITILIKAFNEIQCFEAAKLLQAHMKRIQLKNDHNSILVPSTPKCKYDDEDEPKSCINTNPCIYNNTLLNKNDTNINPVTFVLNHQTSFTLPSKKKRSCSNTSIIHTCLIIFIIVLMIVLAVLIGLYIRGTLKKNLHMKNIIIELETKYHNSIYIAGSKFGGEDGNEFNDSSRHNLSYSHYIRGMISGHRFYRFLYSSSYDPDDIIEGEICGYRSEEDISQRFVLDNDEKVNKIQVLYTNHTIKSNRISKHPGQIRGIRLFTTKGHASPAFNHMKGIVATEQFDGYIAGYVSGRMGVGVNQIQFHWYRDISKSIEQ